MELRMINILSNTTTYIIVDDQITITELYSMFPANIILSSNTDILQPTDGRILKNVMHNFTLYMNPKQCSGSSGNKQNNDNTIGNIFENVFGLKHIGNNYYIKRNAPQQNNRCEISHKSSRHALNKLKNMLK